MRIVRARTIDRFFGVRYVANTLASERDKIEDLSKKLNDAPMQELTSGDLFRLREHLLQVKVLTHMLERDVEEIDRQEAEIRASLKTRIKSAFRG